MLTERLIRMYGDEASGVISPVLPLSLHSPSSPASPSYSPSQAAAALAAEATDIAAVRCCGRPAAAASATALIDFAEMKF